MILKLQILPVFSLLLMVNLFGYVRRNDDNSQIVTSEDTPSVNKNSTFLHSGRMGVNSDFQRIFDKSGYAIVTSVIDADFELISAPFSLHKSNTAGWWTPIVHYNKNVYTAFIDQNRNCVLAKKDLEKWEYVIIDQNIINDPGHTQQSIAIDGDGCIHIFYGMHSRGMKYKRSNIAGSLSGGFSDRSYEFPIGRYTYPSVATATNGDVYLFIRNSQNHHAGEMFRWNNTKDEWCKVVDVAKQPGYTCYPDHIYASEDGNIHLVWEWRQGGAGGNRHLGSYACYHPNDGHFYKANGEIYQTIPIVPKTGDVFQPIEENENWDNSPKGILNHGIQSAKLSINCNRNPIIAYAYSPTHVSGQYHFRFATWGGTTWERTTIFGTFKDFVTIEKMWITYSDEKIRYYFCKPDGDVYLKVSNDDGITWSNEQKVTDSLDIHRIVGYTCLIDGKDYLYLSSPNTGNFYIGIVR